MHGLVEYDLIGRLETFAADVASIREATGMPDAQLSCSTCRKAGYKPAGWSP
jgi:hypothetical protein